MGKIDDFGGLPETVFVPMVRDVQLGAPLGLSTAQQIAILTAIALAEHASAASTKQPNAGDYTIISMKIDNLIAKIKSQGGPKGNDMLDLQTEITNFQNLWA
jgi:hypothetical protein